jgi:hypothetical protein
VQDAVHVVQDAGHIRQEGHHVLQGDYHVPQGRSTEVETSGGKHQECERLLLDWITRPPDQFKDI